MIRSERSSIERGMDEDERSRGSGPALRAACLHLMLAIERVAACRAACVLASGGPVDGGDRLTTIEREERMS